MGTGLKEKLLEIDRKPISAMLVIGYNLLALVSYTIIFVLLTLMGGKEEGVFLDIVSVVIHFIFCVSMAIVGKRSGVWLLSAVLVLIIGFTTVVMIGLTGEV